ncbi:MAG: DUF2721 domain-containing protein [Gemmatimonas sp.]|nr:DUF2721 domain-containing protein [Gemmatimonas sp.]
MQAPIEAIGNPFAILSFIVAPAILTNASSVLAMSTSNRLARAVDRARELSKQLETTDGKDWAETDRRLRELSVAEHRALMLIQALRSFYTALGGFAAAALLSLLGAVIVRFEAERFTIALEIIAVGTGLFAVAALVHGSVMLVRETRLAVQVIRKRAENIRAHLATRGR